MDYPISSNKIMKKKLNGQRINSVGAELHLLDADKKITTEPEENVRRRALKLTKKDNSWGFTLQTYGIKHKKTNEIEIMTYVDYIELGGAAWMAGMRRGDVIMSVNGERVGDATHRQLVHKVRQAGDTLRLVVLYEDCCRKVELHERFLKLKLVLRDKIQELRQLELNEMALLDKCYQAKGISRFELMRQSIISQASSDSNSWDAYSLVSSPNLLNTTTGQVSRWSSTSSMKSFYMGDNSSSVMGDNSSSVMGDNSSSTIDIHCEDSLDYIDCESDSDGISMSIVPNASSALGSRGYTVRTGDVQGRCDVTVTVTDTSVEAGGADMAGTPITALGIEPGQGVLPGEITDINDISVTLPNPETDNSKPETDNDTCASETDDHAASSLPNTAGTLTGATHEATGASVSQTKGIYLPYDKLKNSVPEIVAFHAEDFRLVYINDKDEITPL